jgi:hypothetical protein
MFALLGSLNVLRMSGDAESSEVVDGNPENLKEARTCIRDHH